jgi:pyrrolysine biosynthesis protein PylD
LTRLKATDVQRIPGTLEKYEGELVKRTGCTLLEIAEDAAQTSANIKAILKQTKAAVVPITSGGGVIVGFSQAVAAILNHVGIRTIKIKEVDIAGIAEAYGQGADLMFVADDRKFVAINTHTMHAVDNATSTAKAYVAALDKMAKGLKEKPVLVIGIGHVGSAAISNLILREAKPLAVDVDRLKLRALSERFGRKVVVFSTLAEAVDHTNLIINAAPARDIIKADMIKENTIISAPAIPLGLTRAALRKIRRNLIHDPLQLGVAAMAVEACAN